MRKSLVTASLLVCALARAADKKPLVQSSTSYRPTQIADSDTTVVGAGAKTAGGTALVLSTDSRLSDSRTPTAHASTHASGGSDPLGVGSLSLSMLPSIAASTLLGNNGGVGAAPSALTASQVKTLLAISASDVSGLPAAANPTASVGVTAVNGSASTYMRSDAAPAISSSLFSASDTLASGVTKSSLVQVGTLTGGALGAGFTTVAPARGGSGATSTPTDGQFLIGSSSDSVYHASTLSAGNGIAVTNGHGTATIAYAPTFRQYSIVDVTASTTTSETSITSGSTNGSKTITPPSSGILTCHIHAEGSYITSSSPPTITTRIKKGTTTIKTVAGGVMTLAASQGSAAWKLDAYLTFTSTTTVNYSEQLWGYRLEGSAGGIISPENDLPATGSTVSSSAEDIDVTVQWTSNTAGNTWRTGYYQMDCY